MCKSPKTSVIGLLLGALVLSWGNTVAAQINTGEMVDAHNRWRSQVGSPPLRWSTQLADVAQDWANHLASQGGNSISHRPNNRYGENIYWISGGNSSPSQVAAAWGSEIKYFVPNAVMPNLSNTGNWADVGHYTQLIWKDTSEVGCGVARINSTEIWVCNYNPPGNVLGQNPLTGNVTQSNPSSNLPIPDPAVAANSPKPKPNSSALCNRGAVTRSAIRRGADGDRYQVYYDFRRGSESINSLACGREYWISKNRRSHLYGKKFVYLVNQRKQRVVPNLYIENENGELQTSD